MMINDGHEPAAAALEGPGIAHNGSKSDAQSRETQSFAVLCKGCFCTVSKNRSSSRKFPG